LRAEAATTSHAAVTDRPSKAQTSNWVQTDPGVPVIRGVNWGGLKTLYVKEVRRFFKVQLQTVWAPAVTTLLFLAIFTVALGARREVMLDGTALAFASFVAPGLIIMGMIQNAFANASFSLLIGKIQGTIVDYLMPPLSTMELIAAMVGAAVTRAILVGFAVWLAMLLWPGVTVWPEHLWAVIWFGLMGSAMLGFLGLLTSIWAEKFDHNAAVTNFVVAPLSLLSGTFYSIEQLAPAFQAISHANPFFYIISGFRYGFVGAADSPVLFGAGLLLVINVALLALCYALLRAGWRLRA
jgi:ABC-2 type transport system permease protein